MKSEENYQVTATLSDVPIFGSISMQAKQDGNVSYMKGLLGSESYTETVGGDVYEYSKNFSDNWTKTKKEADETESDSTKALFTELFADLVNPSSYVEVEKNKYKQKDGVEFENCDNVVIIFNGDTCTIEMDFVYIGFQVHATMVISDVGEVEITLPEVK